MIERAIGSLPDGSLVFVRNYGVWHQFQYFLLGDQDQRDRGVVAVRGRPMGEVAMPYCEEADDSFPLPLLESYVMSSLATDLPVRLRRRLRRGAGRERLQGEAIRRRGLRATLPRPSRASAHRR